MIWMIWLILIVGSVAFGRFAAVIGWAIIFAVLGMLWAFAWLVNVILGIV